MKIRKPKLSYLFTALMTGAAMGMLASHAGAQALQKKYVPGQVLVYCQTGTAQTEVQALAAKVNATKIVPNLMKDVYLFILPQAQATDAGRINAVAVLKADANVRWVDGNQLKQPFAATVTPNDPMYAEQWPFTMVNMPEAWVLQKGAVGVEIADIDTGFDTSHEDLIGRYDLANSYNWNDNNNNINAYGGGGELDHGVATFGIMLANTNNAIGVAGIDWQNILGVGEKAGDTNAEFPESNLLASYADINTKYKKAHIVAVNMSLGGPGDPTDTTDPDYQGILQLTNDGLLVFAAAGNSSADNHDQTPSGYPFVTSVSAVNKQGVLTYYSSFGKVDLAAPGGEQYSDNDPNGYLVCNLGSNYSFEQGTSFACPTVTGIAALLMSVPGVTSAQALHLLKTTANHNGLTTLPDPKYGYGIVDAYAALVQVSASVSITAPQGINPSTGVSSTGGTSSPPPVETKKPVISFNIYNIPPASVTFTIDPGPSQISFTAAQLIASSTTPLTNVSDVTLTGTATGSNPQYTLSFRYTFGAASSASHIIQLQGINPANNQTVTDSRSFTVTPFVIPVDSSGVSMVSFPYYESAEDLAAAQAAGRGTLFDTQSVSLYRWLNVPQVVAGSSTPVLLGEYAIFGAGHTTADPGATNPNAALAPSASQYVPTLDPSSAGSLSPIGLGYFIQTPSPISYNTYGVSYDTSAFSLPLHEGWNMIGDPYDFAVDFNSMEVQDLAGNRITTQAAADNNQILPHIYYYSGGDYTFDTLPNGQLRPWQAHWIYVVPANGSTLADGVKYYLIVTPAAVAGTTKAIKLSSAKTTTRAATSVSATPRATGAGSWMVQLQAQTGSLHDNYNYVGESTRATMGMDATKVPKPPKMSPSISLGVTHAGINVSTLAQDLLPVGGTKQWTVTVTTDQKKANVTVSWPNIAAVPRNVKLTLTDPITGNTVDLRNNSSYQFVSGDANATRSFTLTATPTNARGHALITNVVVNPTSPSRSSASHLTAYEIGYSVSQDSQVDVTILGLNGHVLAEVSPTRAVTSGNNTVTWTGLDRNGHTVPSGSYMIQIRAVGPEGEVTRQIVPLTITGR